MKNLKLYVCSFFFLTGASLICVPQSAADSMASDQEYSRQINKQDLDREIDGVLKGLLEEEGYVEGDYIPSEIEIDTSEVMDSAGL